MVDGNRCEYCRVVVPNERARHKQTKYCQDCARTRKNKNSLSSLLPDDKAKYMCAYMRAYRKTHPRLSGPYVRRHREKERERQIATTAASHSQRSLRCCAWLLAIAWFGNQLLETTDFNVESLSAVFAHLELLIIKATSLVTVIVMCWQQLAHLWRDKEK